MNNSLPVKCDAFWKGCIEGCIVSPTLEDDEEELLTCVSGVPKNPDEGVETFDNGEGTNGRVASADIVEGIVFSGIILLLKLSGDLSGALAKEGKENGGATGGTAGTSVDKGGGGVLDCTDLVTPTSALSIRKIDEGGLVALVSCRAGMGVDGTGSVTPPRGCSTVVNETELMTLRPGSTVGLDGMHLVASSFGSFDSDVDATTAILVSSTLVGAEVDHTGLPFVVPAALPKVTGVEAKAPNPPLLIESLLVTFEACPKFV